MDPITFGLIVTALSGASAVLGIGQTGFQFFQNRKRVQEIVQEESFIDLSVIEKRGDRKTIQSIVTELKKAAPQANNIMKDLPTLLKCNTIRKIITIKASEKYICILAITSLLDFCCPW